MNSIKNILGDDYVGFDVNDWGSCQYSGALDTFNALNKVRPEALGIKISFQHKESVHSVRSWFIKYCQEYYNDPIFDYKDKEETQQRLNNLTDIESMFNFARNSAWDLWSAAPLIAEEVFCGLKIETKDNIDKTGIYCWLLCVNGFVTDSTNTFGDFDT